MISSPIRAHIFRRGDESAQDQFGADVLEATQLRQHLVCRANASRPGGRYHPLFDHAPVCARIELKYARDRIIERGLLGVSKRQEGG
jgi:hypothetical protein